MNSRMVIPLVEKWHGMLENKWGVKYGDFKWVFDYMI
jgi:hypothetical protein